MNRETQRTWENVAHYGTVVYRDHDSVLYSTRQNACHVPLTIALHYLSFPVRIKFTRGPR